MAVNEDFSNFCSNLYMNDNTISKIQNRYRQITKRINTDYRSSSSETLYSWYVGSYGRGTEIWTSDIDILVHLPYEIYKKYDGYSLNGQSALLQDIKNSLQKTYGTSYLKGDGQVVGINFKDGINFEIVPAFINTDDSFTYPDSNAGGSWKNTNPKKEISVINNKNKEVNRNLKRLCRMIRSWKENCSVPISGYLIDTLAYNFINNWLYKEKSYFYYDFMSRDFFLYLKNIDKDKEYWLAPGSNKRVNKTGNFQAKASTAYNHTLAAIEYENRGMSYSAKGIWREIYGSKFS